MKEERILCAASAYEKKYYLNPEFDGLPESIKEELQIMCVLHTEDVGGILMLIYNEEGELEIRVSNHEDDLVFDEIGNGLKIKEMQRTKTELFEALQLYYRVFFLKEEL